MGGQLKPEEDPRLYLHLTAVEDGAVLGQVQRLRLALGDEHVEGGQTKVSLLQQPGDEGSDGLSSGGVHNGGGLIREDDSGEGAASSVRTVGRLTLLAAQGITVKLLPGLAPVLPETH